MKVTERAISDPLQRGDQVIDLVATKSEAKARPAAFEQLDFASQVQRSKMVASESLRAA
jgi:hypothetical protein